jgi:hypothetical protein
VRRLIVITNTTTPYKFLVGISPSGAFTYISKAWGGRASDKQITLADGLLDKLDHGDMVMSDRGFLIEEELAVRGVTLAIPAFTKGKKQFSRKDVEKSRQMLRLSDTTASTVLFGMCNPSNAITVLAIEAVNLPSRCATHTGDLLWLTVRSVKFESCLSVGEKNNTDFNTQS